MLQFYSLPFSMSKWSLLKYKLNVSLLFHITLKSKLLRKALHYFVLSLLSHTTWHHIKIHALVIEVFAISSRKKCFSCLFSFFRLFSLKLIFLGSSKLPSTPRKYPLTPNLNYLPPSLYYEILYTDLYLTLAIISLCDYKLF